MGLDEKVVGKFMEYIGIIGIVATIAGNSAYIGLTNVQKPAVVEKYEFYQRYDADLEQKCGCGPQEELTGREREEYEQLKKSPERQQQQQEYDVANNQHNEQFYYKNIVWFTVLEALSSLALMNYGFYVRCGLRKKKDSEKKEIEK